MPKIDIAAVPERKGSGYPAPFDAPCADNTKGKDAGRGGSCFCGQGPQGSDRA